MKTHWERMISDLNGFLHPTKVSTENIVTNMAQGHEYTS